MQGLPESRNREVIFSVMIAVNGFPPPRAELVEARLLLTSWLPQAQPTGLCQKDWYSVASNLPG